MMPVGDPHATIALDLICKNAPVDSVRIIPDDTDALKAELHRLSAANTRLRAAFRINAMLAFGMSHDEIDAALDRIERGPTGDTP